MAPAFRPVGGSGLEGEAYKVFNALPHAITGGESVKDLRASELSCSSSGRRLQIWVRSRGSGIAAIYNCSPAHGIPCLRPRGILISCGAGVPERRGRARSLAYPVLSDSRVAGACVGRVIFADVRAATHADTESLGRRRFGAPQIWGAASLRGCRHGRLSLGNH